MAVVRAAAALIGRVLFGVRPIRVVKFALYLFLNSHSTCFESNPRLFFSLCRSSQLAFRANQYEQQDLEIERLRAV